VRTWAPVARAFAAVVSAGAARTGTETDATLPLLDDVLGRRGAPPGGATG
jgi:hypothetical protein